MHNPESILENVMHKILCHFEIQTDHLISASDSHQEKENLPNSEFAVPVNHGVKLKEN